MIKSGTFYLSYGVLRNYALFHPNRNSAVRGEGEWSLNVFFTTVSVYVCIIFSLFHMEAKVVRGGEYVSTFLFS